MGFLVLNLEVIEKEKGSGREREKEKGEGGREGGRRQRREGGITSSSDSIKREKWLLFFLQVTGGYVLWPISKALRGKHMHSVSCCRGLASGSGEMMTVIELSNSTWDMPL